MSNPAAQRPPTIDAVAAERWARLAPETGSPWLHEEVGRRMAERLSWITNKPSRWLDWAPLRGGLEAHALVAGHYGDAEALVVEPTAELVEPTRRALALAAPWWHPRRWRGGATGAAGVQAELPEQSVGLLWANMALHMAADPQGLIAQWHRSIATDGFLMFSCLGPDTLRELRAVYRARGLAPPSHEFTDMHDWGDMLVGAGFAEPVMDMERIVLTWSSPQAAFDELRGLGRNLHPTRAGGLRGRSWPDALGRAWSDAATTRSAIGINDPEKPLSLTFEIIYGHAFKPSPRMTVAAESTVPLADMRDMLRSGRRQG